MSRFEYNFTRESEFQELKQRNRQLEEENNSLKESLEELINVNNELTESIEELNNNNHYNQNHQDIEERFQMLIEENRNLREQLQNQADRNKSGKRSNIEEEENHTESLVAVLEELIDSFKNIEVKYEAQITDLQQALTLSQKQFTSSLARMEDQLNKRIVTIDALTDQLKRKDEILNTISQKFRKIESQKPTFNRNQRADEGELKKYQERLNLVNKTLQQKERVIKLYQNLLGALKGKIMEKY